jgi:hypothetical protein
MNGVIREFVGCEVWLYKEMYIAKSVITKVQADVRYSVVLCECGPDWPPTQRCTDVENCPNPVIFVLVGFQDEFRQIYVVEMDEVKCAFRCVVKVKQHGF